MSPWSGAGARVPSVATLFAKCEIWRQVSRFADVSRVGFADPKNDLGSAPMGAGPIYHICRREEWERAQAIGRYGGSSQDTADGFIHFSTAAQVEQSAARHRGGQSGLVLLAVDPEALGPALKWEPSRQGALFPIFTASCRLQRCAAFGICRSGRIRATSSRSPLWNSRT